MDFGEKKPELCPEQQEELNRCWSVYAESKSPEIKEKFILHYAYLVKIIAGRMSMHLGSYVDYDDLVSYGIFGLIDAIDKFDIKKNIKFETYASLRIRGSIIDNIRKMDWVPRSLRQKGRLLEQAYSELSANLGQEPTAKELADKLDFSVEEINELQKKSSVVSLLSLDEYLQNNGDIPAYSSSATLPHEDIERQEAAQMIANAIDGLSEKEKKVVSLYYYEDLTLKEISKIMGVSESRISQIHSRAIVRLQNKLGRYKGILFFS